MLCVEIVYIDCFSGAPSEDGHGPQNIVIYYSMEIPGPSWYMCASCHFPHLNPQHSIPFSLYAAVNFSQWVDTPNIPDKPHYNLSLLEDKETDTLHLAYLVLFILHVSILQ